MAQDVALVWRDRPAKTLREVLDQIAYPAGESPEGENCWVTGDANGGLIEIYLRGNLTIAFRRAESSSGEAVQNGFVVHMLNYKMKPFVLDREMCGSDDRFHSKQPLVFSEDIKLVDRIENTIAPFVRFRSFDRDSFGGRDPLSAFERRYGSQKLSLRGSDGEVGLTVGFYAVAREKGGHEDIQGRSHRVDDGSDISMNERVERGVEISDKQLPCRVLWIRLYDKVVWAALLPDDEPPVHDWDMGIGPLDCG